MLDALLGVSNFIKDMAHLHFNKEDNIVSAIVALRTAIRETRTQINDRGYLANNEISDLWLAAYRAFQQARLNNRMLYDKARFWEDPQQWLNEPGSLALVPTLIDLEKECESILTRINSK